MTGAPAASAALSAGVSVAGWGTALPARRVTNHDLTQLLDTSDEDWDWTFGMVLRHAFLLAQIGGRAMAESGAMNEGKPCGRWCCGNPGSRSGY